MKTPKRKFGLDKKWTCYQQARWKRKNKLAQYKRTIARLTQELSHERERCAFLHAAYASLAEFARNAKQCNLLCTDAEQQTKRKEEE